MGRALLEVFARDGFETSFSTCDELLGPKGTTGLCFFCYKGATSVGNAGPNGAYDSDVAVGVGEVCDKAARVYACKTGSFGALRSEEVDGSVGVTGVYHRTMAPTF